MCRRTTGPVRGRHDCLTVWTLDNPPSGAVITYYLRDELKTRKDQRREQEKDIAEKGGDVPYPSWDALRSEEREDGPAVILTVRDADGSVVRRLTGPTGAGLHRVAWNLRHQRRDLAEVLALIDRVPNVAEVRRQSVRIIHQCLDKIPGGFENKSKEPVNVADGKIVMPPKSKVMSSMEELIHQFMLVTQGMNCPPGEIYFGHENPKGELGFYINSRGGGTPYRLKIRSPSFCRGCRARAVWHSVREAGSTWRRPGTAASARRSGSGQESYTSPTMAGRCSAPAGSPRRFGLACLSNGAAWCTRTRWPGSTDTTRRAPGSNWRAASPPPAEPPAPISVWISSMKRIARGWSFNCLSTPFRRCSKSPRYLVPASSAPMSRVAVPLINGLARRRRTKAAA